MANTSWVDSAAYDAWKTSPPDNWDTKCKCSQCGVELFEDENYWDLDDEVYCEECAKDWLSDHCLTVTHEMARGE
jgi:hypothetical protein